MLRCALCVLCVLVCAPAFGQIIYEPVRYEYNFAGQRFYYGGANPHLIEFGVREAQLENLKHYRNAFGERYQQHAPVYSDLLPYRDMTDYRYTAEDARNEAYRNAPLYFRKADLLANAVREPDGTIVVPGKLPSQGYGAPIRVLPRGYRSLPATRPGQIIIIPKNLLDRPLKSFQKPQKQVAMSE